MERRATLVGEKLRGNAAIHGPRLDDKRGRVLLQPTVRFRAVKRLQAGKRSDRLAHRTGEEHMFRGIRLDVSAPRSGSEQSIFEILPNFFPLRK